MGVLNIKTKSILICSFLFFLIFHFKIDIKIYSGLEDKYSDKGEQFQNVSSKRWPTIIGPAYNLKSDLSKNIHSVYTNCSQPVKSYGKLSLGITRHLPL